ncbi:MAG TPA: PDZ domain-containing protein [Rhizomicrobium sp.]|nr:PDZ domain-containing protein [Rhizomicrobium sp.]
MRCTMFRGGKGILLTVAIALALFAGAVFHAVHRAPKPRGFSGLQFAPLTPAAAARTPLLAQGGAQVAAVAQNSPAGKAKIPPGAVVSAIDGTAITSARQASDMVRVRTAGERINLTLYDITQGEVHPQSVSLVFDAAPPVGKKFSVHPPRTLAKAYFHPPTAAANASWSKRILRGPTIKPLALSGLGAGQCNVFVPFGWRVAAHASDNSLFHVMAQESFAHAIYKSGNLNGAVPEDFVRDFLQASFGAPVVMTPPQIRPFGFVVRDFGNSKGGAGFVLYRVTGGRIALWIALAPGGDAGWAKPLVGAVALSMRCASPGAPRPVPRDPTLLATRISLRCLRDQCAETDLAATYLTVLRFGYVHNIKGDMFLVRPRRDYWQSGAEGPGFYHQIGGENEKLLPGRIN